MSANSQQLKGRRVCAASVYGFSAGEMRKIAHNLHTKAKAPKVGTTVPRMGAIASHKGLKGHEMMKQEYHLCVRCVRRVRTSLP